MTELFGLQKTKKKRLFTSTQKKWRFKRAIKTTPSQFLRYEIYVGYEIAKQCVSVLSEHAMMAVFIINLMGTVFKYNNCCWYHDSSSSDKSVVCVASRRVAVFFCVLQ